jgi:hypothetical protein
VRIRRYYRLRGWSLPGDNADLCGVVELGKELLTIFPREAEGAHVGDADPGHNVANGREMSWLEFAIHQRRFRPGYQAIQRQFMVQVCENFSATVSRVVNVTSYPLKMMDNRFGKLSKVVQMMSADLIDDIPVDRLIAVNGDIPEANRFCQSFGQGRLYDLKLPQNLEVLGHRRGRNSVSLGNEMCSYIDRKLDSALEIQRDDVLRVRVTDKLIYGGGSLAGNPLDATPERFQFSFD